MNDNDIIKALECCAVSSSIETCGECPYAECPTRKGCVGEMVKDALDLINRQKAEIERWQSANFENLDLIHDLKGLLKQAKSEAIKEFAERLKTYGRVEEDGCKTVLIAIIDNLVKEMVGDTE